MAPPLTLTTSGRDAEVVDGRQGDRGEGLVELEQVDVAQRQARPAPAPWRSPRDGWVIRQVSGPATMP